MKAWEICKEENVDCKYEDSNGQEWKVKKLVFNSTYYDLQDRYGEPISKKYYLSTIAELDFKEVVDWSKVAVDTKVEVWDEYNEFWRKRYFAKYEDGEIYVFDNGATSWSIGSTCYSITPYKRVIIYEEGEE